MYVNTIERRDFLLPCSASKFRHEITLSEYIKFQNRGTHIYESKPNRGTFLFLSYICKIHPEILFESRA